MGKRTASTRKAQVENWYDSHGQLHARFASKLEPLLKELIGISKIQYYALDSRVKEKESFVRKCCKKVGSRYKYRDPLAEITDVIGLRVITYLDASVERVGELLSREFLVDTANSLDKDADLGVDRVGYRSKHFVLRLDRDRSSLPEYSAFRGVAFEVQVRSLLQHAWAEVEHDRRFKYPGELPHEIRRRYSLIAGQLELADRELDSLAKEVDDITAKAASTASGSSASSKITIDKLTSYLRGAFSASIQTETLAPTLMDQEDNILSELKSFGVSSMGELAALIPQDDSRIAKLVPKAESFLGLVRQAMLLKNPKRYFERCWKKRWYEMDADEIEIFRSLGVDLRALLEKYKVNG